MACETPLNRCRETKVPRKAKMCSMVRKVTNTINNMVKSRSLFVLAAGSIVRVFLVRCALSNAIYNNYSVHKIILIGNTNTSEAQKTLKIAREYSSTHKYVPATALAPSSFAPPRLASRAPLGVPSVRELCARVPLSRCASPPELSTRC